MDESKEQNEAEFVAELTAIQSNLAVFVRGLMPGEQAAEEVIQQTNAKIWLKREDFKAGSNFRAWSFAIARFEIAPECAPDRVAKPLAVATAIEHLRHRAAVGEGTNRNIAQWHADLRPFAGPIPIA